MTDPQLDLFPPPPAITLDTPHEDLTPQQALLAWFDLHQRDLPWRAEEPDPYHVWLSEIMLQQTQVDTVRPYFLRWIDAYPTIADLAAAPIDDIMALWAGLGYYQRARRLHNAAQRVVEHHGGTFPSTLDTILDLPGVGRYTAGAIASIAFGIRAPILDGNVARVLCRLHAIVGDPTSTDIKKRLWREAETILPDTRVGDFNQSLMELGALVCRPKSPTCDTCPLTPWCQAHATRQTDSIPTPRARPEKKNIVAGSLFITDPQGRVLLVQRPREGLLGGLWELPSLVMTPKRIPPRDKPPLAPSKRNRERLQRFARAQLALDLEVLDPLSPVHHTFTHLQWAMVPWRTRLTSSIPKPDVSDSDYIAVAFTTAKDREDLGLPRMVQKALAQLLPTDEG